MTVLLFSVVSGSDVVRALECLGFTVARQRVVYVQKCVCPFAVISAPTPFFALVFS